MIRVAIIDDHYVVRVGLKTIIDMDDELEFAGEASSGEGRRRSSSRPGRTCSSWTYACPGGTESRRWSRSSR